MVGECGGYIHGPGFDFFVIFGFGTRIFILCPLQIFLCPSWRHPRSPQPLTMISTMSTPGSAAAASSLKSSQLVAVTRMLALSTANDDGDASSSSSSNSLAYHYEKPGDATKASSMSSSNPWKILIYDKHTRSIISPLLSVSQLRSQGVTLHLLLHSDREPIPDVPAIYFVQPTHENLSAIARDCSKHLYQRAHLHFSTRMERPAMEEFARLVVNTGGLDNIASVHDQFVEFACLENRLFSLNVAESYVLYNNPGANEQDIEMAMNGIAGGLFSVVATLGCVPVIRCPRVSVMDVLYLFWLVRERNVGVQHLRTTSLPVVVIMPHHVCLMCPLYLKILALHSIIVLGRSTRNGSSQTQSPHYRTSHPRSFEGW